MEEEEGQEVVVVGKRLNNESPTERDWGGLGPAVWVSEVNWANGQGGLLVETTEILDEDGPKVFRFEDFDFEVRIPAEDWARFTPAQKQAITYILTHYQNSPTLTAALQHMSNEGVSVIELRKDSVIQNFNGSSAAFETSPDTGQPAAAAISYDYVNPEGTDIRDGSKAVITFNSNFPMNIDNFAKYLIHEILHPYIPNVLQPSGRWSDHFGPNGVEVNTERANDEMMPRGNSGNPASDAPSIMNVPNLTGTNGVASLGSASGDQLTGSLHDDFLAGMAGDDVLDGISGNDTISGGYGLDTLRAGPGASLLMGGFDADTYIATGYGTSFTVEDTGGVDRLRLPGSSASLTVQRQGDNLILTSETGGYSIAIVDHYLDASRVEIFEFENGSFGASYIEGLVAEAPTHCYDERGVLVPCDEFLTPVILDLKGNGVAFSDVSKSRARFDVNQDGVLDRLGWIKGKDDLILALDRNGNGKVDGPSEISFLADFAGARSDMEGLLGLDSNRDGFLTAADDAFDDFVLWNDRNGNGRSDRGELIGLEEAGIMSIGLEIFDRVGLDGGKDASQILGRSTVTFSDGTEITAFDVALQSQISRPPGCGCGGSSEALPASDMFYVI